MIESSNFLHAFAQALSALALYPEGHTSRERALDAAYQSLFDLLAKDHNPEFSFLGDEVIYNDVPLREFRDWDWSRRLSGVGVQRVEFDNTATRDQLEEFLDELIQRLQRHAIDSAEARQMRPSGIRWGAVGLEGHETGASEITTATISFTLGEEAEAIRWMHNEVTSGRNIPVGEAEAVVRALTVAMHGDQNIVVPLLKLRRFDEYTTTHSMNVSVLAMALSEWLGMGARDVRAFGVAGLLHDLGKVTIPIEVLNKAGKLTDRERAIMNAHPVEGARLILAAEEDMDLAAVVAYEHHIMLNGGGYPAMHYHRDCHHASKLVHVCDVYDALRTNRPYRDAWPADKVLAYLEERSGVEFDGQIAHAFTQMMHTWEPQLALLEEEQPVPT
jgi:putative nucleotidyltransferase with HDIG domain